MNTRIKSLKREYRQLYFDKLTRENKTKKLKKKQIQRIEHVIESLIEYTPYSPGSTDFMITLLNKKLEILSQ